MPELYDLANQHITGFLGVLREKSVVYLATVQSEGPVALTHRPGSQAYLHSTAMGKALLAEMSDERCGLCSASARCRASPRTPGSRCSNCLATWRRCDGWAMR